MHAVFKFLLVLTLFTSTAESGLAALALCKGVCVTAWYACVSTAAAATGGTATPAAIAACNVAEYACSEICILAGCRTDLLSMLYDCVAKNTF